jgi:hypothetical protein
LKRAVNVTQQRGAVGVGVASRSASANGVRPRSGIVEISTLAPAFATPVDLLAEDSAGGLDVGDQLASPDGGILSICREHVVLPDQDGDEILRVEAALG